MKRYIIYPQEIAFILGKSYSYSCKLARTIKDARDIQVKRDLTIQEFCDYMDLPFPDIFTMINEYNHKTA
ncbi:hypothetical protein [Yeosuana sp. AK3]